MGQQSLGICKIHGEQFYLMAKLAGSQVCSACVAEGFFIPEITDQIEADFPLEMKSTKEAMKRD